MLNKKIREKSTLILRQEREFQRFKVYQPNYEQKKSLKKYLETILHKIRSYSGINSANYERKKEKSIAFKDEFMSIFFLNKQFIFKEFLGC